MGQEGHGEMGMGETPFFSRSSFFLLKHLIILTLE